MDLLDHEQELEGRNDMKSSILINALPVVVQNRMPNFPSIRRSISALRARSLHGKANSVSEAALPDTPPPEYSSRPGSGSSTPHRRTESLYDFDDGGSIASVGSSTASQHHLSTYETNTGISWQVARHGIVALEQSHRQACAPLDGDEMMATIIRSQYVHSITLLLRSLPSPLSPAERLGICDAIPEEVLGSHAPQALSPVQGEALPRKAPQQTLLWQVTAWFIFRMVLLVQMMLPYVKLLVRSAVQFENKHQVTKRMFNTGVAFGSGFSRECWRVSRAVCQMNDGMLGDVVADAAVYCAESIGGGIQQGLADARSQQLQRRRDRQVAVLR